MDKVKLKMFNSEVILIKGSPEKLKKKVNLLIKSYGCRVKSGKVYNELQPDSAAGRTIYLIPDVNDENCKGIIVFVIAINNEANKFKFSNTDQKRVLIEVISHEIRHIVDRIISPRHIADLETPAYLTGFITSELLIKALD